MAKARKPSRAVEPKPRVLRRQPAPPLAYRINDAAQAIGVGRTKLYTLIAEGKIVARKRDGLTFIRAVDLDAYLMGAEEADAADVTNDDQASIK